MFQSANDLLIAQNQLLILRLCGTSWIFKNEHKKIGELPFQGKAPEVWLLQRGHLLSSSSTALSKFPLPSAVPFIGLSGLAGGATQAPFIAHVTRTRSTLLCTNCVVSMCYHLVLPFLCCGMQDLIIHLLLWRDVPTCSSQ